jgi:manganese transport protein
MPHNLYLHSFIVKYRANADDGRLEDIDLDGESTMSDTQPLRRKKTLPTALQMSHLDSILALAFALFVNSSILIIAAANFFVIGKNDVADIPEAFELIGKFLGSGFSTLFAVALLFAGQSSTITGTMAGQIVMEGFLGIFFSFFSNFRNCIQGPCLGS